MSSLLEERYRRVLRMLPSDYRQAWEEDMVASFMQAAYAAVPDDPEGVEISRPSLAETASIAALALRVRLGGTGAAPRPFVWGEAVRRVALIGLLAHAIGALFSVVYAIWAVEHMRGMPMFDGEPLFGNLWVALWSLTGLLWLPTYLSAVHGHHRAARILAVVAFLPVLIKSVLVMASGVGGFSPTEVYQLLFGALPVLALASFGPDAPRVRARPWLIALPVGVVATVVATAAIVLAAQPQVNQEQLLPILTLADQPGLWCVALTGAAVVHLIIERRRPRRTPVWPLALALLVPPVLILRVITMVDYLRFTATTDDITLPVTIGAIQCAALVVTGVMLAGVAARRLRHLPAAVEPAQGQTAPVI